MLNFKYLLLYIQNRFSKIDTVGNYFFNYIILIFAEQNWNLSVILHFNSIHDKINYHKSDTLRWSGAKLVHYFQR